MSILSARISPGNIATTDSIQTLTNKTVQSSAVNNSLLNMAREVVAINATAAGGPMNYDVQSNGVVLHTVNATANIVLNFRATNLATLASILPIGQATNVVLLITNGGTAYYVTSVQVDGTTSGVTTRWQNSIPVAGNANCIDCYTFAITRTGASTYTILASQTKFA